MCVCVRVYCQSAGLWANPFKCTHNSQRPKTIQFIIIILCTSTRAVYCVIFAHRLHAAARCTHDAFTRRCPSNAAAPICANCASTDVTGAAIILLFVLHIACRGSFSVLKCDFTFCFVFFVSANLHNWLFFGARLSVAYRRRVVYFSFESHKWNDIAASIAVHNHNPIDSAAIASAEPSECGALGASGTFESNENKTKRNTCWRWATVDGDVDDNNKSNNVSMVGANCAIVKCERQTHRADTS